MHEIFYINTAKFEGQFTKSQLGKIKLLFNQNLPRLIDLLLYVPVKYVKFQDCVDVSDAFIGSDVTILLKVVKHIKPIYLKGGRKTVYSIACLTQNHTKVLLNFFKYNQTYLDKFVSDKIVRVRGKLTFYRGNYVFSHPSLLGTSESFDENTLIEAENFAILPKYSLVDKVAQNDVKNIIKIAIDIAKNSLSEKINVLNENLENVDLITVLEKIHFPDNEKNLLNSIKTLAFAEFSASIFTIQYLRKKDNKNRGFSYKKARKEQEILLENFAYPLTCDQKSVFENIEKSQLGIEKIFKLIQGDVGSGKTIVALLSCLNVVKTSMQAMFLAPTTILAMQHFQLAEKLFLGTGVKSEILTSKITAARRKKIVANFKNGEIDVLFGTHSLLNDELESEKIGLIIIDEQHRFGVKQRMKMVKKQDAVDIIMMSATPIPRTLAMGMYGDIDVLQIVEKPSFQKEIQTSIMSMARYEDLISHIAKKIDGGEKIYWICSLIDDSDGEAGVFQRANDIKTRINPEKIAVLHGKMKEDEKNAIIKDFQHGNIALLIATTVVEVGVNIPMATVIIVEDANKFGLAQLHQLRGRVGRGNLQSYCILLHNCEAENPSLERLKILKNTSNGFEIAKEDMRMRGTGSLLGTAQSGDVGYKIASIQRDFDVMEKAVKFVKSIIKDEKYKNNEYISLIMKIFSDEINEDFLKS